MQTFLRSDWAPALARAARALAIVAAVLIVAAETTHRAGLAAGRAVHWLSDRLAGLVSGRIDRAATARAVVAWAHAVLDAPAADAPACPLTPVDVVTPDAPDAPDADAPTLAETFAAVAAAAAASDARLFRAAGERIASMRAMLDAAETDAPAAPAPAPAPVVMACAAAAPAPAPAAGIAPPALDSLTVAQLRAMARARGITGMGRARRADLLAALSAPAPVPAAIAAISALYDAHDGGQCDPDAMISAIGRTVCGGEAHLWIDSEGLLWPGSNVWGNLVPLLSSLREDT